MKKRPTEAVMETEIELGEVIGFKIDFVGNLEDYEDDDE